jgi:hypothetical protein
MTNVTVTTHNYSRLISEAAGFASFSLFDKPCPFCFEPPLTDPC